MCVDISTSACTQRNLSPLSTISQHLNIDITYITQNTGPSPPRRPPGETAPASRPRAPPPQRPQPLHRQRPRRLCRPRAQPLHTHTHTRDHRRCGATGADAAAGPRFADAGLGRERIHDVGAGCVGWLFTRVRAVSPRRVCGYTTHLLVHQRTYIPVHKHAALEALAGAFEARSAVLLPPPLGAEDDDDDGHKIGEEEVKKASPGVGTDGGGRDKGCVRAYVPGLVPGLMYLHVSSLMHVTLIIVGPAWWACASSYWGSGAGARAPPPPPYSPPPPPSTTRRARAAAALMPLSSHTPCAASWPRRRWRRRWRSWTCCRHACSRERFG